MSYTITGTITEIHELKTYEKFSKQQFIIEVKSGSDNQYSDFIKMMAKNDKTHLLAQFDVGSHVTIDFNIKGNKWEKDANTVVYFTDLEMWRMANSGEAKAPVKKQTVKEEAWENNTPQEEANWDDDLPF